MSHNKIKANQEIAEILAEARAIKYAMKHGALSYYEAKELVKPLLEKVNQAGKILSKQYGRTYRPITFIDL